MTRTMFEVKRSDVKVTRMINAETESVLPTNFKFGRRLEHALSLSTVMASWVIARGRGNIVSAALGGHATCCSCCCCCCLQRTGNSFCQLHQQAANAPFSLHKQYIIRIVCHIGWKKHTYLLCSLAYTCISRRCINRKWTRLIRPVQYLIQGLLSSNKIK